METPELIQHQRQIGHRISEAVARYRQTIASAQQQLETALARIEAARRSDGEQAKQEIEQAKETLVTRLLDAVYPLSSKAKPEEVVKTEQNRRELRARVLAGGKAVTIPLQHISDAQAARSEASRISSIKIRREDIDIQIAMLMLMGTWLCCTLTGWVFGESESRWLVVRQTSIDG